MLALRKVFAGTLPLLLLAPLLLLLGPSRATATDPLRCEIKKASEKLRDYFAGRRIREIALGDVSNADPTTPSTAGPGIRKMLREELERIELKVRLKADVGLSVAYRAKKIPQKNDRKAEKLVVELFFTVVFNQENTQEDLFPYRISNDEANRHILGLTAHNTKAGRDRDQQTILAFTTPKATLDGTAILAGKKAPYAVEILVAGQPLTPKDEDGFGLVKLQRDQTYAIRLVNRSKIEAAVRVSVDGLNVFTFSELRTQDGPYKGAPRYDMVLIPPGKSVVIPGWHRTNTTSHQFKITKYADTAAAQMGKSTDIGTITATFCAAWEKTPPKDEPDGSRGPGDDGTGVGAPIQQNYAPVQRTIGAVRASVAVRYRVPPVSE